jgi:hypothetical protein
MSTTKSQLKQMIEEQLEGLILEKSKCLKRDEDGTCLQYTYPGIARLNDPRSAGKSCGEGYTLVSDSGGTRCETPSMKDKPKETKPTAPKPAEKEERGGGEAAAKKRMIDLAKKQGTHGRLARIRASQKKLDKHKTKTKTTMTCPAGYRETEQGCKPPESKVVTESQLKQMIEEQLEGLMSEQSYAQQGGSISPPSRQGHRTMTSAWDKDKGSEVRDTYAMRGLADDDIPEFQQDASQIHVKRQGLSRRMQGSQTEDGELVKDYGSENLSSDTRVNRVPLGTEDSEAHAAAELEMAPWRGQTGVTRTSPEGEVEDTGTTFIKPADTRYGQLGTKRQVAESQLKQMIEEQLEGLLNEQSYAQQGGKARKAYQSRDYQSRRVRPEEGTEETQTFMTRGDDSDVNKGTQPIQVDSVTDDSSDKEGREDITIRSKQSTPDAAAKLEFEPWKGETFTTTTDPTTGKTKETGTQFIQPANTRYGQLDPTRQVTESQLKQMIEEQLEDLVSEQETVMRRKKGEPSPEDLYFARQRTQGNIFNIPRGTGKGTDHPKSYSGKDEYSVARADLRKTGLGDRGFQSRVYDREELDIEKGFDDKDAREKMKFRHQSKHRGGGKYPMYQHMGMKARGQVGGKGSNFQWTGEADQMAKTRKLRDENPEAYARMAAGGLGPKVVSDVDITSDLGRYFQSEIGTKTQGGKTKERHRAREVSHNIGDQTGRYRLKNEPVVPQEQWKPVKGDWEGQVHTMDTETGKKKKERMAPFIEPGQKAYGGQFGQMSESQLKQMIEEELQDMISEKAKSKSQQRFMGMVHKCQETGDCASEEVRKAANSMKKKDAEDFASTKHKGLPEKKKKKKPSKRKKK